MRNTQDDVILVLSGTELLNVGALSLLELIEERNYKVKSIYSTSGSSFLSVLWALGYNLDDIQHQCLELTNILYDLPKDFVNAAMFYFSFFKKFNINRAIINPAPLKKHLLSLFGNLRLEDCKIPVKIILTDIMSMKPVVIESGCIREILFASLATPPLLPPSTLSDPLYPSIYADGIFTCSIPLLEATQNTTGKIIVFNTLSANVNPKNSFTRQYTHFVSQSAFHAQKNKYTLAIDMHNNEILFINIRADNIVQNSSSQATELLFKGRLQIMRQRSDIDAIFSKENQ